MATAREQHEQLIRECLGNLDNWKYAGGSNGPHFKYWKSMNAEYDDKLKMPAPRSACLCGHGIIENCFVINEETLELEVLGNCCIRKFIPKSTRTCHKCHAPHRNRKRNLCTLCRKAEEKAKKEKHCVKCDEVHNNRKHNVCNDCRDSICWDCGRDKECNGFRTCWSCFQKKKNPDETSSSSNSVTEETVMPTMSFICQCGRRKKPQFKNCYACGFA